MLSDHNGFLFNLIPQKNCISHKDKTRGRLKPAPKWCKPDKLISEAWQEALANTWNILVTQLPSFQELQGLLSSCKEGKPQYSALDPGCEVQTPWDLFMQCLRACFKLTITQLLQSETDEEFKAQLREMRSQPGADVKGKPARFKWVSVAVS